MWIQAACCRCQGAKDQYMGARWQSSSRGFTIHNRPFVSAWRMHVVSRNFPCYVPVDSLPWACNLKQADLIPGFCLSGIQRPPLSAVWNHAIKKRSSSARGYKGWQVTVPRVGRLGTNLAGHNFLCGHRVCMICGRLWKPAGSSQMWTTMLGCSCVAGCSSWASPEWATQDTDTSMQQHSIYMMQQA